MDELDQILLRIKYALQSLTQGHQRELTHFIEHYASEYELLGDLNFDHMEMETKDAKKIN